MGNRVDKAANRVGRYAFNAMTENQTNGWVCGKQGVLYDKFGCWDEGEYLGSMSEETKKLMRSTAS